MIVFSENEKKRKTLNGAKLQQYGSARDQYLLSWKQIRLFFIAANSMRSNACIITIYSCGPDRCTWRPSYNAFDLVTHTWSIDRRWTQNSTSYEPNRFVRVFQLGESLSNDGIDTSRTIFNLLYDVVLIRKFLKYIQGLK